MTSSATESRKSAGFLTCLLGRGAGSDSEFPSDESTRRRYVLRTMLVVAPMQFGFFVYNLASGGGTEALLDLLSSLLFVSVSVLICRFNRLKTAYWIAVANGLLLGSYSLFFDAHEAEAIVLAFYVIPLVFFYLFGVKKGALWIVPFFAPIVVLWMWPVVYGRGSLEDLFAVRLFSSLGMLVVFAGSIEWFRLRAVKALVEINDRLHSATEELETLGGLVPICAYCKKLKNDKGYWSTLEKYLESNTSAQISSGLCEKCAPDGEEVNTGLHELPEEPVVPAGFKENMDDARRSFVVWVAWLGAAVIWAFAGWDLVAGRDTLAAVQSGVGVLFVGAGLVLRRRRPPRVMYHLVVSALFVVMVQPFLFKGTVAAEILWFLVFPVCVHYLTGATRGTAWVVLLALLTAGLLLLPDGLSPAEYTVEFKVFFGLAYFVVSFVSYNMEKLRFEYAQGVVEKIEDLVRARQEIRTLKGMVPVCSSCKAVFSDEGFWTRLEVYLHDQTELQLSHSVCTECLKKEMPDMYQEMLDAGELED